MHVLITGGSGFIGQALCPALLEAGHELTVLTRNAERAAQSLPQDVALIERLDQAERADAVVNLAGEPLADGRWTEKRKREFRHSRLGTTKDLIQWIEDQPAAQRPRVLVSGSAIGYYGPRGDEKLDEAAPPGDDFAATLCRDWEHAAQAAEAFGLRVAIMRIGVVLGPGGGALAKMLPPFKLGAGGPMGDGQQWMSWVHRQDLASLILWLLENKHTHGPHNATAPEPVRNREFAKTLAHVLHRPALITTPALALKLMFGEMSTLLLTGQRVVPAHATAGGFQFKYPELEAALREVVAAQD